MSNPIRKQLEELLARLEAKGKALLQAEIWNDIEIEKTYRMLWVFKNLIGYSDEGLNLYLSHGEGKCTPSLEEAFKPDEWNDDDVIMDDWMHDYTDNLDNEQWEDYLPKGWVFVPWYEFNWDVTRKPATGEKLLGILKSYIGIGGPDPEYYVGLQYCSEFREFIDPNTEESPEDLADVLVVTGYLSNQEKQEKNTRSYRNAYKKFNIVLEQVLSGEYRQDKEIDPKTEREVDSAFTQSDLERNCQIDEDETWKSNLIQNILHGLPACEGKGYIRVKSKYEEILFSEYQPKTNLKYWLEECIGDCNGYYEKIEEASQITASWVEQDEENNVTVWHYDEEYGDIDTASANTFNTLKDAKAFWEELGGHWCVVKIVVKEGEKTSIQIGDGTYFTESSIIDKVIDFLWRSIDRINEDPKFLLNPITPDEILIVDLVGGEKKVKQSSASELKVLIKRVIKSGDWPLKDLRARESTIGCEFAEQKNIETQFQVALDDCNFDKIFNSPEKFQSLIIAHIKGIAENFMGDNKYEATGSEPPWLLSALLEAGADVKIRDLSDAGLDSQIIFDKQQVEPQVSQSSDTSISKFNRKRICITGKLVKAKRSIWEGWIKDSGGIIASNVSKNTDYLIVGSDAGSKLVKAIKLGIKVVNEAEALTLIGNVKDKNL